MKIKIFILICILISFGCKKPKVGRYALTLNYDQTNNQSTIYGDETKVTSKNIIYGGAFSDISGTLDKKSNKVSGELTLFPNYKTKNTISIDGKIKGDGKIGQHKIEGTFSGSGLTGKFTISPIDN